MERYESLHHTKWECKYHVVWTAIQTVRGLRLRDGEAVGVQRTLGVLSMSVG